MTPTVIEYGWIRPREVAYELSTGHDRSLWGVTVVAKQGDGVIARYDLGNSFSSEKEAREYIDTLRKRDENGQ
jgi:hypothetical protein